MRKESATFQLPRRGSDMGTDRHKLVEITYEEFKYLMEHYTPSMEVQFTLETTEVFYEFWDTEIKGKFTDPDGMVHPMKGVPQIQAVVGSITSESLSTCYFVHYIADSVQSRLDKHLQERMERPEGM